MKIIYIIGKSSVGKDTIYKILKEKLDIKPYVLYTTRPIRTGEADGIDYNFLSDKDMKDYIENFSSKVIEFRTYNTIHGPWTYATILDNQFLNEQNLLMEGTLESYNGVKKFFDKNNDVEVVPIYIEVDDGIRLERALKREREQQNPKYVEMCRRFIADSKDFSEDKITESEISRRFQNIKLEECVNEIIEYINTL